MHEARSSQGSASDSPRTTCIRKRADWIWKVAGLSDLAILCELHLGEHRESDCSGFSCADSQPSNSAYAGPSTQTEATTRGKSFAPV